MRILSPIRNKASARQQVSSIVSYQSPVGGWNSRDSIAAMNPSEALILDNFFPRTSYVEGRGGYVNHATGMTGTGKTLAVHNSITGTNNMFCSTASGVYEVTSSGVVGASLATRTNGKHQWLMFGDGTNNWLIMVNGVDKPLYYDGATWTPVDDVTSPALTGVTTSTLIGLSIHKGRLMFIQKDTMAFWYLPSGVAGGALTKFDLSGVAQKGGYLMAMSSITIDSGNGPDDRAVFVTSQGEVIVYQGTNPSSASSWALIGIFSTSRPLGRRCLKKVEGDLIIITQQGVLSLALLVQASGADYKNAVSNKIERTFTESALFYGNNFGWSATLLPSQSALLINIPVAEDGIHYQYVMNTITKSWCRFTGWNAEDLVEFNGDLYFCNGTSVFKSWSGTSDGGANIDFYAKSAFSYFGGQSQLKHFKLFRPVLSVNGNISFLADIDVDFEDKEITGSASYSITGQAQWDVSSWDLSYWSYGLQIVKSWLTPSQWTGYSAAGKLKISTNTLTVQWVSSDYVFESGGVL